MSGPSDADTDTAADAAAANNPSATSADATATAPPAPPPAEPKYGGHSRFEIELEFVQSLGNPVYLNHLAVAKVLQQPAFVAYLDYLRYWTRPPYLKYLTYPGPTLRSLELLQHEQFRRDIIMPELVNSLVEQGMRAAVEWHMDDKKP